ncbi:hypothetical protein ACSBR2_002437 [Camellia fascicularis]
MARQQEEGWPLGLLQPLNERVGGLVRNSGFFGSASFHTFLSASPPTSSSDSTSDLDTESTGSFFHEKSITLGSLLGVSTIVDLSRTRTRTRTRTTSIMRRRPQVSEANNNKKKTYRFKPNWCISLCPRDTTDAETVNNNNNTPSLGHFLAVERMAANEHRRSHNSPLIYGPEDEVAVLAQLDGEQNSLFVNGSIAPPPHSSPWFGSDEHGNGYGGGVPVLFSCMCGQAIR